MARGRTCHLRRRYHEVMATSQLIPPPELSPPSIAHLDPADRIRIWAEMVAEGDRFLYQGFLDRHGSEEAARRACAEWLERRDADATEAKIRMLQAGSGLHRSGNGSVA